MTMGVVGWPSLREVWSSLCVCVSVCLCVWKALTHAFGFPFSFSKIFLGSLTSISYVGEFVPWTPALCKNQSIQRRLNHPVHFFPPLALANTIVFPACGPSSLLLCSRVSLPSRRPRAPTPAQATAGECVCVCVDVSLCGPGGDPGDAPATNNLAWR